MPVHVFVYLSECVCLCLSVCVVKLKMSLFTHMLDRVHLVNKEVQYCFSSQTVFDACIAAPQAVIPLFMCFDTAEL